MNPKLNDDTFYVSVAEGVYLRNTQGSIVIKGKTIYHWIETLAPYLNGKHTLDELTVSLDPHKAQMVRDLVTTLHTNGFVRDVALDLPHTLSPQDVELYAPEIAFIDATSGSGAHHFETFRRSTVLVIGSGVLATGLIQSLLRCGLEHVSLMPTAEDELDCLHLCEIISNAQQRDSAQSLTETTFASWDDDKELRRVLRPYDIVVHASDRPMLERVRRLTAACVAERKRFLPTVLVRNIAWIGPLSAPGAQGCWECAWRRLQANLEYGDSVYASYAFSDDPATQPSEFLYTPMARIAAAQAAFALFHHITGEKLKTASETKETSGNMLALDLETALTQTYRFLPHPFCQSCSSPLATSQDMFCRVISILRSAPPRERETFSQHAAGCLDSVLGILTAVGEEELSQMPLRAASASIANPMLLPATARDLSVAATDVTFRGARQWAAQRGLELYAASVVDRRRTVGDAEADGAMRVPRELFLDPAVPEAADPSTWVWAYALPTGEQRLVPAELAFPALTGVLPTGETLRGVASGMSWNEAVVQAVLDWYKYLTVTQMQLADKAYPLVDLAAVPLDPQSTLQRRMLDFVGEMISVYDVTGTIGAPTFAMCLDGPVVAYATHLDVASALRAGFMGALCAYQFREHPLPGATEAIPDLPQALRSDVRHVPSSVASPTHEAMLSWLEQSLRAQGWQALVVPLDHDPAVVDVLPQVVRVLLARADGA